MDFGRVECIYAKGDVGSGGEGGLLESANVYMRIRVGMRFDGISAWSFDCYAAVFSRE